jgi:aminopeptidase
MNGLTIEVDNTDAEGRLILADALFFAATQFKPRHLIDVATLTGAIHVGKYLLVPVLLLADSLPEALGDRFSGVFCNNDKTWSMIRDASDRTGQKSWRMPLDPCFLEPMKQSTVADLINAGSGRGGGSCTAAAFLDQFIDKHKSWAHFDIAGTMSSKSDSGVLAKGMTGAPTRTLIQLSLLASVKD